MADQGSFWEPGMQLWSPITLHDGQGPEFSFPPPSSAAHDPPISYMEAAAANAENNLQLNSSGYTASATTPSKRVACDICRNRKVRCDQHQPSCRRCLRLGHTCKYTYSRKRDAAPPDVSQTLTAIQTRLARAEALIARGQLAPTQSTASDWTSSTMAVDYSPTSSATTSSVVNQGKENHGAFSLNNADAIRRHGYSLTTDRASHKTSNSHSTASGMPSSSHRPSQASLSPTRSIGGPAELSEELISSLQRKYFDTVHFMLPIVDQTRFTPARSNSKPHIKCLSYAIAMIGAMCTDQEMEIEEQCYALARDNLELAESQRGGSDCRNIQVLQAFILVAWYEFRHAGWPRAWMTLGRAVRLTQMLCLQHVDADDHDGGSPAHRTPLGPVHEAAEAEERRYCFWTVFILDIWASLKTGEGPVIRTEDIMTRLPASTTSKESPLRHTLAALQEFKSPSSSSIAQQVSPFAAGALFVSLYFLHQQNFRVASEDESHSKGDFWSRHYYLDKMLTEYTSVVQRQLDMQSSDGLLNFLLLINLPALSIQMHDAMIAKGTKEGLPTVLISESEIRRNEAAMNVVKAAALIRGLSLNQRISLQHVRELITTPFEQAETVLDNNLRNMPGEFNHIAAARQLLRTMKEELLLCS